MTFEILDEQTASSGGEKPEVKYKIVEYNDITAALAELTNKFGNAVFDVSTKKGMEDAKHARADLRGYRTNLEATRKRIKEPALTHCRRIDWEAKDITAQLEALEKPIAAQIDAEEARKEAEKQAKLNAEIARVTALRERIAGITAIADNAQPNSASCQEALAFVKAIEIGPDFQELQPDAQQAKDAATFRLQNLFAQYTASEAEAEQIRIDREKLAQLEAESAARRAEDDRKAAEERARLQAEQDARIAAEVARLEAEQAEQRRQQEAETQRVREAQAAEQKRLDEQAAALRQQQREAAETELRRVAEADAEKGRQERAAEAAEERVRAAAPLLLEACKQALFAIPTTHGAFQTVRDAIAAAEGSAE